MATEAATTAAQPTTVDTAAAPVKQIEVCIPHTYDSGLLDDVPGASMRFDPSCTVDGWPEWTWPFTVADGVLHCEGRAVYLVADGSAYAINGLAMTWAEPMGLIDVRDSAIYQGSAALGPVIDAGLALCDLAN
ncbi:MAG: DUF2511 domain-containing protein [Acidimicrobiales bacterium]